MRPRFRDFVRAHPFPRLLAEAEAAPAMGAVPPTPSNPENTTNKHHFDFLQRQLGIDDDDFKAALEQGVIDIWKVPDYSSKWGYLVQGPVSAQVEQQSDGNYSVTFLLRDKKKLNPKHFFLPYHQGEQPMYYEGPVKDETEIMGEEELEDAMAEPFKNGGAPAGGMGGPPGMGGAPGMGGGAPPGMPPMGGAPGMGGGM